MTATRGFFRKTPLWPVTHRAFVYLPLAITAAAVLWSWVVRLLDWGTYFGDVDHYMRHGRRLAAGELQWAHEFADWLPAAQFLFLLPSVGGSLTVWRLMAMAAALLCAYCVYHLTRDIFAGLHGLAEKSGHYAGLYGAAFTLYILSSRPGGIDKFNGMALAFALAALLLCRLSLRRDGDIIEREREREIERDVYRSSPVAYWRVWRWASGLTWAYSAR